MSVVVVLWLRASWYFFSCAIVLARANENKNAIEIEIMAAQVPTGSGGSSSSSSSGGVASPPGSTTDSYDGPKIQFDTDSFGPPEVHSLDHSITRL